jgi:hypothetical protein
MVMACFVAPAIFNTIQQRKPLPIHPILQDVQMEKRTPSLGIYSGFCAVQKMYSKYEW